MISFLLPVYPVPTGGGFVWIRGSLLRAGYPTRATQLGIHQMFDVYILNHNILSVNKIIGVFHKFSGFLQTGTTFYSENIYCLMISRCKEKGFSLKV